MGQAELFVILGIISDTHGNRGLMFDAVLWLVEKIGAEWVYHAGDNYEDAQELDYAGYKVRAVPGLWCPQYTDGRAPRRILDRYDGVRVAMAHAAKDLRSVERAADVVITGHTHRAALEKVGRSLYVNPGHLRGDVDRGERGSFASVEIVAEEIRAAIHELDGSERMRVMVARS